LSGHCSGPRPISVPADQRVVRDAGINRVAGLNGAYRKARSSDQKRQISDWPLDRILGMTAMQRTKLNALGRTDRKEAMTWLSPRQRSALEAGLTR